MSRAIMPVIFLVLVAVISMGASSCEDSSSSPPPEPTAAEKLAAIDGSASSSDFQTMLDCLTTSGAPGTETETDVADTLEASWEESSQQDSLWEFSQALASVYGC